jgi:hypothetical protein
MNLLGCNFRCNCTVAAVVTSLLVGVVTAFLQITAVITVTPVFLWVAFGIAVVYLGVLAATGGRMEGCGCLGVILNTLLAGILLTIFFALILLAVGITATSVISAILVGLLLFSFTLTLTSAACVVRCLFDCVG